MNMRSMLFLVVFLMPVLLYAQPGGRGQGHDFNRGGYQRQDPSTLSIFSENGELFYLVLNGVNQNNTPLSRIRVEGLPQYGNDVQIMFADNVTPGIRRKVNVADPLDGKAVNMTLKIERARNGAAMLKFFKCRELERNFRPEQGEFVMNYGNPTQVVYSNTYNDPYNQQVTTTTTTIDDRRNTRTAQPVQVLPSPMDDRSFSDALHAIKSASFSDTKMSTAKAALGQNYLTTDQVRTICGQFSFEDDKMAFIKYIYKRIIDQNNIYKLGSVFAFDSNKQALNDLIGANQR